jgi:hypothetical protein
MAALTPEEKKKMAAIMSQSVPSPPVGEVGAYESEYDTEEQVPGSIWRTISPALLARRVFDRVKSELTPTNQKQWKIYDESPYHSYPDRNLVLANMDRQNDKWEKLGSVLYHEPPFGSQSDKNLFERTLYEEMVEIPEAKQKGREVNGVRQLGKKEEFPEDIEAAIGQYITGKKGSLPGQVDQLKQVTGVSLAPRPSGRGRCRTHKRRHRSRKTRRRHK